MGIWTVISANSTASPCNEDGLFGTHFRVTILMRYVPTFPVDRFVHPPKLDWDETILINNYTRNTREKFNGNMYLLHPISCTMEVWSQRYFRAYLNAHNQIYINSDNSQKGTSKLLDKNGLPVPGRHLGIHTNVNTQNTAVMTYLSCYGGHLEIEIHDRPGIKKPESGTPKHIERVLIFNCGVEGNSIRAKAWQHLKLDSAQPEALWTRDFERGNTNAPGLRTAGLVDRDYYQPTSFQLNPGSFW